MNSLKIKLKNNHNNNLKNIIKLFIIVCIIICATNIIIEYTRYQAYKNSINNFISQTVANIKEKYPNISEEEIIKSIKEKNISNESSNILKKYGYNEESIYLSYIKEEFKKSVIMYAAVDIVCILATIIIFIIYVKNEKRKIQQLNDYLKEVNNGHYELGIIENTDDELSKLRNEIYKTTILLREAAENSKKESTALSDSLADISHQLKTPLTSIRIMLDNIEDNPNMDEATKKDFLQNISNQVDWMSSLVISLLKLSRFDAGMIIMDDKNINLKELINNVIKNLSIMLELKNITVEMKIKDNIEFNGDYKWQLEALTNITKNAIEHSKENTKVIISAEQSSVFTKIIVQDNGEGISQKDIKYIFERFYKAKNSSENSIGIGLALSKSIIEKENGLISVKSEEGKGTSFTIKYLK